MAENCNCGHHHEEEQHPISKYEQAFRKFNLELTDKGVHDAVTALIAENKEKYQTEEVKKALLGTVELTTLKTTDSQESVLKIHRKGE